MSPQISTDRQLSGPFAEKRVGERSDEAAGNGGQTEYSIMRWISRKPSSAFDRLTPQSGMRRHRA